MLLLLASAMAAMAEDKPFSVSAELRRVDADTVLSVSFTIAEAHFLYAERIGFDLPDGVELVPSEIPEPKQKYDESQGREVPVYSHDLLLAYVVRGLDSHALSLSVKYQGCNETLCFLPQSEAITVTMDPLSSPDNPPGNSDLPKPNDEAAGTNWRRIADRFTVRSRASGYMKPDAIIAFLRGESGEDPTDGDVGSALFGKALWISILLIILGGLALNLTPCVLPMIPVNIAIIGAGAQGGSRAKGFLLGTAYGAGIALAYGALGVIVILTGVKFGSLNSSPWFNVTIAALFLLLSISMFGVFNLDLSSFMSGSAAGGRKGSFLAAFMMGGVAALLAGACVAPVLISVLLFSANLYSKGAASALLLPFLLGIGMASPWPFAGAGLSFLPKPGKWMTWVKYGFGILIFGFAVWYALQANHLFMTQNGAPAFAKMLETAAREEKPIFLDFGATWCKNCAKMEKTTFVDSAVKDALRSFAEIKYQAEDLNDPEVREILDYYGVVGLPAYLVLERVD